MSATKVCIQYMSDLHQEAHDYDFIPSPLAPFIILSGNIGRFCDYDRYRELLARFCTQYELVLLIAGNHEFYGSSRDEGLAAAARLIAELCMNGRQRFLNRGRVDLHPAVTVLGCTLHSHIADDYTRLTNDFARISGWRVEMHNEEHQADFHWLQTTLQRRQKEEPNRKVVIATHHAPTFSKVCHPQHEYNDVSQCFSSTAMADLQEAGVLEHVTYWIFGHTHWNVRPKGGDFSLVSNQMHNDSRNLSWWQRKRLYRPFDPKARLEIETKWVDHK